MPFGLCIAPSTFQRTMNNLLADCRGFADVYIDEIVIYSRTLDEHLTHLRAVLLHLRAEKLFAKLKKCSFGQRKIKFCGYLVNREGIKSHPDKVTAISNWPTPRTVKYVRSFLGLAGFYQRFVKNFADTAAPLISVLKRPRSGPGRSYMSYISRS